MKIPTIEACYRMMGAMEMLDHIVVHSLQVCRVATYLTENLNEQGISLNLKLIQSAALLHDITKTRSFKTKENHAATGAQHITERGYPEVGDLVRQHVRLDDYPQPVQIGEAQVLNYADKRVLHDKVVTLEERLAYILEKYGTMNEQRQRIHQLWEKTKEIETGIFRTLPFFPDDVTHLINSEDRRSDFIKYQHVCKQLRVGLE